MTYRILMDCDPGIDDACALSCALTDPEISLELITTVAGNVAVDKKTKNALRLVEFFSKDVPVAAGARKPLLKQLEDASKSMANRASMAMILANLRLSHSQMMLFQF